MIKIHPSAFVESNYIGEGIMIWQFCVTLKNARIGKNCDINFNVFIENDVTIGNDVTIKPGVQVWDRITIEGSVFIGPNVIFTNDRNPKSKNKDFVLETTLVKKGVSIGANSTILPGIIIGKNAVIGAGNVVIKNMPANETWFGNPAKKKNNGCIIT